MLPTTLLCLAFAAFNSAQSTTVSIFLPDTDPQSLVASVVAANPSATTYLIQCPPAADPNDCGYGGGASVTSGPSTYELTLFDTVAGGTSTVPLEVVTCHLGGTTQAVCTMSVTVSAFTSKELQTTTLSGSEITLFPVVVTAGQQLLASARSVTGGGSGGVTSTEATSSRSSVITPTSSMATTTSIASGSSSAVSSASSNSRTGGSETSASATPTASGTSDAAGSARAQLSYAVGALLAAGLVAVAL